MNNDRRKNKLPVHRRFSREGQFLLEVNCGRYDESSSKIDQFVLQNELKFPLPRISKDE